MLTAEGLGVRYGTVQAVTDLSLTVGDAEVLALLGPNGAGKTSTLRALSRLCAYQGKVTFDGEDIAGLSPDTLARRGLIHVPEGRQVFGPLTVHENLQAGLAARAGRPSRYSEDDVYDLFPALVRLRGRTGWSLSGGEQQMVAVGRALVSAPRVLMLDEPTLGLAPLIVHHLYEVFAEVSKQVPLLLVEQNTSFALKLCTRAQILVLGRVVMAGSADELGDRSRLLNEYLGQTDIGGTARPHSESELDGDHKDNGDEQRQVLDHG